MTNGMNIPNLHNSNADRKHAAGPGKALKASSLPEEKSVPGALNGDVANDTDSGVSAFRKIYNEIAQCNKIAQSNNGSKNGTRSSGNTEEDNQDNAMQTLLGSEVLKQLGQSQNTDIQQILNGSADAISSGNLSAEAAALIREAIAVITKTLNLKIQDGLDNLTSITPSQGIIDQFAEMLSTLKGIAAVLDESVTLNQPLECKNLAFDVESAAKAQQVIHEQMFKIEMALKMLGISGEVAASMTQKDNALQDAVATLTGIPQASDPSKLSMPVIHVKQVLGELFDSKEQKVETLLAKLAETLKKNGSADATTSALLSKIASAAQGDTEKAKVADIKDIGSIDSQVLRKILKVDAAQATESENKTAAQQNVTIGLPKEGKVLTSKTFADVLSDHKSADNTAQTVSQNAISQATDKLMSTLRTNETGTMRQLEQSVITQVVEKLNVAMKTGITEIRVMLRPESLGEVQLKIKVEGDVVTGKMYVESQQVKHIVEANLQTLKDSLSQHNLSVGSFSVDVNHGNGTHQQMYDLAQMGAQGRENKGNNNGEGSDEPENAGPGKNVVSGIETGRKFGTNTIEYFA
jgi:flagellar hook-length control protein FliK